MINYKSGNLRCHYLQECTYSTYIQYTYFPTLIWWRCFYSVSEFQWQSFRWTPQWRLVSYVWNDLQCGSVREANMSLTCLPTLCLSQRGLSAPTWVLARRHEERSVFLSGGVCTLAEICVCPPPTTQPRTFSCNHEAGAGFDRLTDKNDVMKIAFDHLCFSPPTAAGDMPW